MRVGTDISLAPSVEGLLKDALNGIKGEIVSNMGVKGRNASGRSVRSLSVEVIGNVGYLYGHGSFMAMETGRRGGRVPRGFHRMIREWIVAKGISVYGAVGATPEQRLRSAAFLIARKIAREGTLLHRRGERQNIYTLGVLKGLDELGRRLLVRAGSEVARLNDMIEV